MKSFKTYIKNALLVGISIIIPAILLIYLIVKVIGIIRQVLAPIADKIDISILGRATTSRILAILILVIICFIVGLIVNKKKKTPIKDWIESNILSNIPGYSFVKGMTEAAVGLNSQDSKEVVLVNIEEVWQIGYLMDRLDDDLNTVFIPSSPNPMAGDVVFVKWDRLRMLDIDQISVVKLYRKLGNDSKKLLNGKLNKSVFESSQDRTKSLMDRQI